MALVIYPPLQTRFANDEYERTTSAFNGLREEPRSTSKRDPKCGSRTHSRSSRTQLVCAPKAAMMSGVVPLAFLWSVSLRLSLSLSLLPSSSP